MTDWVHRVIDDPAHIATMKQEGAAEPTGVLSKLLRYEKLRWYGNGFVQISPIVLFLFSFLTNTIAGLRCALANLAHRKKNAALQTSSKILNFKPAVCALNQLILTGMQVVVILVLDQMHPSCPAVLRFLPLLGTSSTIMTIALLIVLSRTPRDHPWTAAKRIRISLDVLCLVLFVL